MGSGGAGRGGARWGNDAVEGFPSEQDEGGRILDLVPRHAAGCEPVGSGLVMQKEIHDRREIEIDEAI